MVKKAGLIAVIALMITAILLFIKVGDSGEDI